ncbi:MAG: MFS transporter, partial [Pirellulaceae bacterium]|nr:MFS transporter [Pirellulaceae bacterium]
NTPPPAKGEPLNIRSLLMLDAMKLMKNPGFAVFAICSALICIPLGYYYGQTSNFLGAAGFKEAGSMMTIGQMSEIFFMLLIPFFFRKLGVKMMLLIGMGCWVLRYALFAMGAPDQVSWMLFMGVALHGICYDFFFVTGFMYTDNKAPKEIRGQAQGLLVFLTQGLGMFFGFRFAFGGTIPFTEIALPNTINVGESTYGAAPSGTLVAEVKTATEGQSRTTLESLLAMFDKGYPESESITVELINQTGVEWQLYWVFPAILAGVVFVVFGLAFWDRMTPDADEEKAEKA